MKKRYLNVAEVAEMIDVSPTTIYRMLYAKQIPVIKIGGQWRFPTVEIEKWLASKIEMSVG